MHQSCDGLSVLKRGVPKMLAVAFGCAFVLNCAFREEGLNNRLQFGVLCGKMLALKEAHCECFERLPLWTACV